MKILICLGTGGVGKTSVAAAAGFRAATEGDKTLVLTIDPARRLRTTLGLDRSSDQQRVPFTDDLGLPGELWAAVLDVRSVLDRAVRLYAKPGEAQRVLEHPIYHTLISSLSGMQELLAIERLDQAISEGFETIVVDTAPSRHAFEFLDKPEFFAQLASLPLVRLVGRTFRFWEKLPLSTLSRKSLEVYSRLESLLGSGLLRQVLDFYSVFLTVAEGYAQRARKNSKLLRDPSVTSFWIISTPFKAHRDGEYFLGELRRRSFSVETLLVNRLWRTGSEDEEVPASELSRRTLKWFQAVCLAHAEAFEVTVEEFSRRVPRILGVPELPTDVDGLSGLMKVSEFLA